MRGAWLFLHGMNGEERLIGLGQGTESSQAVRFEILRVTVKHEAESGFLSGTPCPGLRAPFVDRCAGFQRHGS